MPALLSAGEAAGWLAKPDQSHFWAKTTPAGAPGVSVYEHMLNVGRVAQCLAQTAPELLARFNLLGRVYIGVIAPFHRQVVKAGLRRAAHIGWPKASTG